MEIMGDRDKEVRRRLRTAAVEEQPSTVGTNNDKKLESWMKSVEKVMKCLTQELKELKTSRQRATWISLCTVVTVTVPNFQRELASSFGAKLQ